MKVPRREVRRRLHAALSAPPRKDDNRSASLHSVACLEDDSSQLVAHFSVTHIEYAPSLTVQPI
ncbi:hypothetical protein C0Q70_14545 [Pomacea canaliculata]|uniref:Uncharacterized protein n=1 Tax=Pomacea canaliculata TaxID=400727 RepID=A0A2T7NSC8_POMCA|nr:hypothetical protein C0Q70_14545 [Pomacea canaliculata]